MALRWIRKNIQHFSGDPARVTIFGVDSGAAMAHGLLLSPMARGLFQKVILQSGSLLSDWGVNYNHREATLILAKLLGSKQKDKTRLATYFRSVPPFDLVEAANEVGVLKKLAGHRAHSSPFCISLERQHEGEIFMCRSPRDTVARGNIPSYPLMIGYNQHEGMLLLHDTMKDLLEIDGQFESFVPAGLNLQYKSPKSIAVAQKIREFYFGDRRINKDSIPQLINMFSDIHIVRGIHETLKTHRVHLPKIYFYKFAFDGRLNFFKHILKINRRGVSHGDELFYLFKPNVFDVDVGEDSREYKTRQRMVRMWTNFAKTGNPTPTKDSEILTETWKPLKKGQMNYMDISGTLKMKENPFSNRIEFWENLSHILRNKSVM